MREQDTHSRLLIMTALAAVCVPLAAHKAEAARAHGHVRALDGERDAHVSSRSHARSHLAHGRHHRGHQMARGISCVPFAREETGIEVTGNAVDWWHRAAGIYARGNQPEIGSVLNFRANSHMALGHVAAVKQIIDSRHLVIDHANWAHPGSVSRGIDVVDVSADNDWTLVRVELGHTGEYGSIYPTYGFIYARADNGTKLAEAATAPISIPVVTTPATEAAAPIQAIAAAPIQSIDITPRTSTRPMLRHVRAARTVELEEVAEVTTRPRRGLDLTMPFLSMDAPNRSLR
jgi:surface antigen